MDPARKALTERIKTLRRRHFGQRGGAAAFAAQLGITEEEYKGFERGTVPPGDMLVKICEQTGEDMQWLLTGVAGRGTVVISNTRVRHQALLGRLAQFLEEHPDRARPFESLLDLLTEANAAHALARDLPAPPATELIPIYAADSVPQALPNDDGPGGALAPLATIPADCEWSRASFVETSDTNKLAEAVLRHVDILKPVSGDSTAQGFLHLPALARAFPSTFAVAVDDDSMSPRIAAGDAVVVTPGIPPRLGMPALVRLREGPARIRLWLGEDDSAIELAALRDGARESLATTDVCWSLEVLFIVSRAA